MIHKPIRSRLLKEDFLGVSVKQVFSIIKFIYGPRLLLVQIAIITSTLVN